MQKGKILIVAVFAALLLGIAGSALAQTGGPVVQPRVEGRVDRVSPQVQQQQRGSLPFTGSDLVLFAIVGIGVVGAGSLIVARTRRQPQPR